MAPWCWVRPRWLTLRLAYGIGWARRVRPLCPRAGWWSRQWTRRWLPRARLRRGWLFRGWTSVLCTRRLSRAMVRAVRWPICWRAAPRRLACPWDRHRGRTPAWPCPPRFRRAARCLTAFLVHRPAWRKCSDGLWRMLAPRPWPRWTRWIHWPGVLGVGHGLGRTRSRASGAEQLSSGAYAGAFWIGSGSCQHPRAAGA